MKLDYDVEQDEFLKEVHDAAEKVVIHMNNRVKERGD